MPVSLIGIREVGISLYRSYVGRLGISVPARGWAKVKTVVQDVAVGFALLPLPGRHHHDVPLRREQQIGERIRKMFASRGREMAENNLLQADVPDGATVIEQRRGTAPGLICPVGHKVVYAVPGVPHEMQEMVERAVLPDLQA